MANSTWKQPTAKQTTSGTSKPKKPNDHRNDIDGLRGVAVLAVLINHINEGALPGGYLGVDIFFVISGFVITASISKRHADSYLSFISDFYSRRFKRLIPALICFVMPIGLLVLWLNPQPAVDLTTGASSLIGYSNIYLFKRATDYFASTSQLNPFLQTWSLGIEEQFYLIFPSLLWISGFARKRIRGSVFTAGLLTPLIILSFTLFASDYSSTFASAYFLPTSRFWELASGCIVFLLYAKWIQPVISRKDKSWKISLAAICCTLVYTYFFFEKESSGYIGHLAVVASTCILILANRSSTALNSILSSRALLYIGAISYSLYLWHWGILAIARNTIGVSAETLTFLLPAIFLISHWSYSYVETPWRHSKNWSNLRVNLGSILGLITLFLFGKLIANSSQISQVTYLGDKSQLSQSPSIENTIINEDIYWLSRANSDEEATGSDFKLNNAPSEYSRRIIFIGDSHTSHLFPAFKPMLINLNKQTSAAVISRAGTRFPTLNWAAGDVMTKEMINKRNYKTNANFSEAIQELSKGDLVIISNNMHSLLENNEQDSNIRYWDNDWNQISPKEALNQWLTKLDSLRKDLKVRGIKVAVIAPTPIFESSRQKPELAHLCSPEWFRISISEGCPSRFTPIEYRDFKIKVNHFTDLLITESGIKKELVLNLSHLFCDQRLCRTTNSQKQPLFIDTNHLSTRGAKLITSQLTTFTEHALEE